MNADIINILIIDDSPYDRELIKNKLKKNFPSAIFILGEGIEDYKERTSWVKPDVILCDYEMKDCNGLEILMLSKKSWDVPFIFVTGALNNEESVAKTILQGANGYVLKDNMDELYRVVSEALEVSRMNKQVQEDKMELVNLIRLDIKKAMNLAESNASYQEIKSCLDGVEKKLEHV